MAQTKNSDLVLSVACQEEATRTWVLEPKGRNSFRIVVRCRKALGPHRKACSWFSYFGAIVQAMLPVFAPWRTGESRRFARCVETAARGLVRSPDA
jgi:hypothetical protein